MPTPRYVTVKLTHGRSVPVSVQGDMIRIRKDGPAVEIPFQVYLRYAHKLELVGDSIGQVNTAMQESEVLTAAPSWSGNTAHSEQEDQAEGGPLPEWPMQVPPEEYIKLFGKRKGVSKTVKARLDLARQILAAQGD